MAGNCRLVCSAIRVGRSAEKTAFLSVRCLCLVRARPPTSWLPCACCTRVFQKDTRQETEGGRMALQNGLNGVSCSHLGPWVGVWPRNR